MPFLLRTLLLTLISGLLWQCSISGPPEQLSADAAHAQAIVIATQSAPEIAGSRTPPQVVASWRSTWRKAQAADPSLPELAAVGPATAAWVIELRGEWVSGMAIPGVANAPAIATRMVLILDAHSGALLVRTSRP